MAKCPHCEERIESIVLRSIPLETGSIERMTMTYICPVCEKIIGVDEDREETKRQRARRMRGA